MINTEPGSLVAIEFKEVLIFTFGKQTDSCWLTEEVQMFLLMLKETHSLLMIKVLFFGTQRSKSRVNHQDSVWIESNGNKEIAQ